MTDSTPIATEVPAEVAPVDPAVTPEQAPAEDELTKWKGFARTWEQRAKENATAAEELAKLRAAEAQAKEAAKTVEEQLAELRSKFEQSTEEAARLRVAAVKGVPAELLADIKGDEATLAAFADKIVAFRGAQEPAKHIVPGVGAIPATPPTAEQRVAAAEASGDLNASLAAKSQLLAQRVMGQ